MSIEGKKERKNISRREFLKTAGMLIGGVGAVAFVNACSAKTITSTATTTAVSTATTTSTAISTTTQVSTITPTTTVDLGNVSIATWPLNSTVYIIASGFGKALLAEGAKTRLVPVGTSVARLSLTKYGDTDITGLGSSDYVFAGEGAYDFSEPEWGGPQKLRLVIAGPMAWLGFLVKGNSGINSFADMKGKRLVTVPGSTYLDILNKARLATAGLTMDDVTLVQAADQVAGAKMVMSGQADGAHLSPTEATAIELAAMPGSIKWLNIPASDTAAWDILMRIAPFCVPTEGIKGPNLPPEGVSGIGSPYGFVTYDTLPDEKAYFIIKGVWNGYDLYKDVHAKAALIDHACLTKAAGLPFHDGVVKFFKEEGAWTSEMQTYQDRMLGVEQMRLEAFTAAVTEGEKNKTPFGSKGWKDFWSNFLEDWINTHA